MGIVLDIILIALIGISIFLGYRKGLIKVAVKLFAFLIAAVLALVLYKPVSNLIIEKTNFDEMIENVIIEKGTQEIQENKGNVKDDGFISHMQNYVEGIVTDTQNEIVTNVAKVVSVKAINLLALIGMFIITRLSLNLMALISEMIARLPILKQFNKLGGTIYGVLRGLIVVYLVLAIVFFIVSATGNKAILALIDSSIITKFMYTNNMLLKFIF